MTAKKQTFTDEFKNHVYNRLSCCVVNCTLSIFDKHIKDRFVTLTDPTVRGFFISLIKKRRCIVIVEQA